MVRTPRNPSYRWGNHLWLPEPPAPHALPEWNERARAAIPGAVGVCLRWDGPAPEPRLLEAANALGMRADGGLEMAASTMRPPPDAGVERLDLAADAAAIDALNAACDPGEGSGDPDYDAFKAALRATWRTWPEARWWGIRCEGVLVAQCGLVDTPHGGRLQSVETHPAHRGRGLCTALVGYVSRHALDRGLPEVLLGADPDGAARRLYRRLGFVERGWQHALVDLPEPAS